MYSYDINSIIMKVLGLPQYYSAIASILIQVSAIENYIKNMQFDWVEDNNGDAQLTIDYFSTAKINQIGRSNICFCYHM